MADDTLIKGYDDDGPIRYMDEEEIKERLELNIANTSSSIRARMLKAVSDNNGHSSIIKLQ